MDAPGRSGPPALTPDHFCILVDDLLAATRRWEALGFIVTQAGASAGGGNVVRWNAVTAGDADRGRDGRSARRRA